MSGTTRDEDGSLDAARRRVLALGRRVGGHGDAPARLVETHVSWVLLAGDLVWKLKKPLRLPFLDYSTFAGRRRCCEEEVRLGRRLAPSVYLGVDEVRETADGPVFGGADGTPVDCAVRMRRFPDDALWSVRVAAGAIAPGEVDAMARRLAAFHRDEAALAASDEDGYGTPSEQVRVTRGVVEGIGRARAADAAWPALRGWLLGQAAALAPLFEARRRAGRVRECHGDLHLANVLTLDGAPAAFDGIEFDPRLRCIDVLDDAAFLVMDLLAHGRRDLAFGFLDGWLEAVGDHDGLPALRFFLARRALVRSQVASIAPAPAGAGAGDDSGHGDDGGSGGDSRAGGGGEGTDPPRGRSRDAPPGAAAAARAARSPPACGGDGYFALAAALAGGADARLAVTHGLPGSGKSHVARGLVELAGAIRLRSDVERKRLHGLGALEASHGRVAGGIYGAAATATTYERLRELARAALEGGWPVVVDAAFLRRDERARFAALARGLRVPWTILDCRAPDAVLRARLAERQARGGDASEADAAVLDRLRGFDEPLDDAERAVAVDCGAAVGDDAGSPARAWLAARRAEANDPGDA